MKTIRVVAAVICDSMQEKYKIYATARGYGDYKGQSSSFIPGILSISAEVRCHIRWYGVVSLAALNF